MLEYDTTTLVIIDALVAVIPGYMGWRKGYSFFVGWLISVLLSPLIAIPALLLASPPTFAYSSGLCHLPTFASTSPSVSSPLV